MGLPVVGERPLVRSFDLMLQHRIAERNCFMLPLFLRHCLPTLLTLRTDGELKSSSTASGSQSAHPYSWLGTTTPEQLPSSVKTEDDMFTQSSMLCLSRLKCFIIQIWPHHGGSYFLVASFRARLGCKTRVSNPYVYAYHTHYSSA